jgi:ferrous iron transport protein B
MILGLLAPHGAGWVLLVFTSIAATGLAAGALLHRFARGETPELFIEIPPYHLPQPALVARKVWIRVNLIYGQTTFSKPTSWEKFLFHQ